MQTQSPNHTHSFSIATAQKAAEKCKEQQQQQQFCSKNSSEKCEKWVKLARSIIASARMPSVAATKVQLRNFNLFCYQRSFDEAGISSSSSSSFPMAVIAKNPFPLLLVTNNAKSKSKMCQYYYLVNGILTQRKRERERRDYVSIPFVSAKDTARHI